MEYKFTALDDVEVAADTRTIKGYASVFGDVDSYGDTIVKGAYSATIKANKTGLPMLWQHNTDNLIGRWTSLKEDDKGLIVEGRLTPGHSMAEDVYASLKNGDVDGMSIGFSIPAGGASERGDGVRVLKKIDLREVSVVVMPADRNALISAVKAADMQRREFRALLQKAMRDAGCELSRKDAEALLDGGFGALTATRDAGGQHEPEAVKSALLDAIRTARG
ncbi:HK97 family phage prohead protease [Methylobacterium sp. W2]|uniref:HK97 family phage prohead protease n=1 Tax=Methylobacterium sp. W2 TaxID=2598107 RepID=UPI001D0C7B7C|nr:HK97 family phage prohead protease [Methylobacterium sp. W2]MCC0809056.1 HK97 family phage prohead protease [Methylobacterium sp. W2]